MAMRSSSSSRQRAADDTSEVTTSENTQAYPSGKSYAVSRRGLSKRQDRGRRAETDAMYNDAVVRATSTRAFVTRICCQSRLMALYTVVSRARRSLL